MAPKVTAPEQFTGERSGLEFVAGVAEVDSLDDAARAVLADHGFTVEATEAEVKAFAAAAVAETERRAEEQRAAEVAAAAESVLFAEEQRAAEATKQAKK